MASESLVHYLPAPKSDGSCTRQVLVEVSNSPLQIILGRTSVTAALHTVNNSYVLVSARLLILAPEAVIPLQVPCKHDKDTNNHDAAQQEFGTACCMND